MAIQSQDQMMAAMSAGQVWPAFFNKNTSSAVAQAIGFWYDLSKGFGNPQTDAVIGSGTNLTFQPVSENTVTTATTAALGGSIAGTVFTDTTHGTGRFTVGTVLTGTGVIAGTAIVSLGTGIGANNGGTYNVSISQTVTAQTITGTATGSFLQHGGNVSPLVKHMLTKQIFSAAPTTAPCILQLVDVLGFIPVSTVTVTTPQAILGVQTLPRAVDGAGVFAYITPVVNMGAGAPTLQLNYTRPGGTAGRLTPAAPSLPVANASAAVGQIIYSGTGVGKTGPFMPLQAGDNGILSIQSITQNASMTSGVYAIVLCKMIGLPMPISTQGVASERDLLNMLPSMPILPDGCAPNWLMYAGNNTPVNSSFMGAVQSVWG